MIQATVRRILVDDEDVGAIVNGRVYDTILPTDIVFPCITMQRISETLDTHTMFRSTRLQIDGYAQNHEQAVTLAEAIQRSLTNKTHTYNDIILSIQPKGLRDIVDAESRLYRVAGDYMVIWRIQ